MVTAGKETDPTYELYSQHADAVIHIAALKAGFTYQRAPRKWYQLRSPPPVIAPLTLQRERQSPLMGRVRAALTTGESGQPGVAPELQRAAEIVKALGERMPDQVLSKTKIVRALTALTEFTPAYENGIRPWLGHKNFAAMMRRLEQIHPEIQVNNLGKGRIEVIYREPGGHPRLVRPEPMGERPGACERGRGRARPAGGARFTRLSVARLSGQEGAARIRACAQNSRPSKALIPMFDIRAIRETPDVFRKAWNRRKAGLGDATVSRILELDTAWRAATTAKQDAESARNANSKLIGQAKAKKDEAEAARLMALVADAKTTIEDAGKAEDEARKALDDLLMGLPNLPLDEVPEGTDEHGNVEKSRWGTPKLINNPKDHADLGEALKVPSGFSMMDFEAAARMSGARFVALRGQLARMERALANFMLDIQTTEHGYQETSVPLLVRDQALSGNWTACRSLRGFVQAPTTGPFPHPDLRSPAHESRP